MSEPRCLRLSVSFYLSDQGGQTALQACVQIAFQKVDHFGLEPGVSFRILEGAHIVGAGHVLPG